MISTFDELIHEERGKLLGELPKDARVFCSAGCAGRWYFDWVEKCYGPIPLHYGVELFSRMPDDLPPNVDWLQNSAGAMVDVPTGSVDLLFSGQNIEHLFIQDLKGFLAEANRVIRAGGHLCLDSPNRTMSQAFGYTQPQHVLELSVDDAALLLEASGFEVQKVRGIWSCRDGDRLYSDLTDMTGDIEKRRSSAHDCPQDSFIWWIVAQKTGPIDECLDERVETIASRSFPAFVQSRYRKVGGKVEEMEGTDLTVRVSPKETGCIFHGPYVPLRPGDYQASFDHRFLSEAGSLSVDVVANAGTQSIAGVKISPLQIGEWSRTTLRFSLENYTEGVEARLFNASGDALVRFGAQIVRS